MKPFLITGLPRSRTAWWSVVATTQTSDCVHEPLKFCKTFEEVKRCWNKPLEFVGVADSGFLFLLDRILAEVEPKTLIIERDVLSVERSFTKYLQGMPYDRQVVRTTLSEMQKHLDKNKHHELVKRVWFEDLNNEDVVEECFDWIMPGNPYLNKNLLNMNIQVNLSEFIPTNEWYKSGLTDGIYK